MPGAGRRESRPAGPKRRRTRHGDSGRGEGLAARIRRLLRWALLFASFVVAVDALFGDKGLIEMLRARQQHADLSGSIDGLRADNARLREAARRLKEDPATIEGLARRELGLIRPGEVLFVVKDKTKR
jgi:cell division protein FtsB